MRQAQTRRNGWRWLALAVGTLSALSLAEASMARWPAGWQVSDLPAAQPGQAGAGQRQRAVKLQADGSQALVMEVTRMPLQSGQAVNLEKVLGHMRKLVQIEFLRNGLQTACTSPQPSTTGGLAALETTCTIRQRGAVVMSRPCSPRPARPRPIRCPMPAWPRPTTPARRKSARYGKACASSERNRTRSGRGLECRRITPAALFALRRVALG